ncbi:hypothetical protein BXZ70DRAFT_774357 [Cristinia sonorae]|uniref:GST N-terminal domain-containing protein n=1 Tax=Cristinia sonorae TaxID=1940300 RepID=A0A8K0XS08_9AGAR|nr:hypothetical protein BXZ70DRAFT_774357 [Cristinia sonorae]
MTDLILYDILGGPSPDKALAFSPNTWVVRYALNLKGLKYRTVWIEYPDIESVCKKLGAAPTAILPDGITPFYTLPVLQDLSKNTVVPDSLDIIAYLDKTYPDTQPIFPPGTHGLYAAIKDTVEDILTMKIFPINIHAIVLLLNDRSAEYFRRTREGYFGAKLEDIAPPGSEKFIKSWQEIEAGLAKIAKWYDAAAAVVEGKGEGQVFLEGGKEPGFPEFYLASRLLWARVTLGETSEGWMKIKNLDSGRWGRFMDHIEQFGTIF